MNSEEFAPEPYFERSILESLFERQPSGFLLCGVAGSGKSTLLQAIALKQVENVLRRPQSEKIDFLSSETMERW